MTQGSSNPESIIRYWQAVELLQPQAAPKLTRRSNLYDDFLYDTPIQSVILPWEPESYLATEKLPPKRIWSHTLFAYLYNSQQVAEHLKKVFGADQGYCEPQSSRESALFSLKFTTEGLVVEDSFVLSSEAWFLGKVLSGHDWTSGFEEDQQKLGEQVKSMLGSPVSRTDLQALTQHILQAIGVANFFANAPTAFRFRSKPIKQDKSEQEDDPLNSFFLEDLALVARNVGKGVTSHVLDQYLNRHDPIPRLHMDNDSTSLELIKRLMPHHYAEGCWPSEQHLGLVHSQQLAVNTILSTLSSDRGLLGVNGPPGTGKTTLLRDLIAAIVVQRADVLAELPRASDAFIKDGRETANNNGKNQTCYKLESKLFGFEIVVASSNNGAVENITLELPQRDKIDESWLPDAEYFADLGTLITSKPSWGMISGALGSKARRKAFIERYFFGQPPEGKTKATANATTDDVESAMDTDQRADIKSFAAPASNIPDADHKVGSETDDDQKKLSGFLGWLTTQAQINESRTAAERQALWQQAVAEYEAAKDEANQISTVVADIRWRIQEIRRIDQQTAYKRNALHDIGCQLDALKRKLTSINAEEAKRSETALSCCMNALNQHLDQRPGILMNIFSLGGAKRRWKEKKVVLEKQMELAQFTFNRTAREATQLTGSYQVLERQAEAVYQDIAQLKQQLEQLRIQALKLASAGKAEHLTAWLQKGIIGRGEAVELAEPWQIPGWREARARVFIQALKLHQTFFALEPKRLRSNLNFINAILTGSQFQGLSREAIRSVWASLFMVVPVLSSTFASFARTFSSLGPEDIGWLLIDEAGQATPQAAVGALWRARRAVLVGDPLQLKPIITVSDAVLEHMRTHYQVETHWLPNRQSAQTLADEATPWGRMAGPADQKIWVGLPLAVHRRCDRPMYELSNRIAYDSAMVYGTTAPNSVKETPASLLTGWIDVSGSSDGNWVPAEGIALKALLATLHNDGVQMADISVITPFKGVLQQLQRILPKGIVRGTIHTMQGKESAIVIMVLGGNTKGSGARDWVVSEPNLLNVAATRAKRRFYVIGDRQDWQKRALFCDVMDLLPEQHLPVLPFGQPEPTGF